MNQKEYHERVFGEGQLINLAPTEQEAPDEEAVLLHLTDYPYVQTLARLQNELNYDDSPLKQPMLLQIGDSDVNQIGHIVLTAKKFNIISNFLKTYEPKFMRVVNGRVTSEILITDLLHTIELGRGDSINGFI